MAADLPTVRGDRGLIVAGVPLGRPKPKRTVEWLVAGAIGIPLGLGIECIPLGLLLGIGGGAFVTFVAGATAFEMARMRRFATENNVALGALGRGELAKAREVFVRWAPSRNATISAMARHNLGWTLMLEGRVEDAARILEDAAEHYARALNRFSNLPTTRLDTALCYALLGNIELAETWCAKADEPVKAPQRPTFPGMMALLRALIDCRKNRAAEAMVSLEHAWAEHEATMTGETLRMMRVVRAFACAGVDAPRNQGLVERVLGDMKPRYEGEFAFL